MSTTPTIDQAHLDEINARLPKASPHAAYTLALLTTVHAQTDRPIPQIFMDGAMQVSTLQEAVLLAQRARDYLELEAPRRPRRNLRAEAFARRQEAFAAQKEQPAG